MPGMSRSCAHRDTCCRAGTRAAGPRQAPQMTSTTAPHGDLTNN
jgi:hypothetical protein